MVVTLKLGEPIWQVVGEKSLKVELHDAHTVADLFAEVNRRYPRFAEALNTTDDALPYNIFRNDSLVYLDRLAQMPIADGDKIFIFMAVSGG